MGIMNRRWARKRFNAQTIDGLPDRLNLMALSKALGVSLATVQHWVVIGLKARKIGARWEVLRGDLREFLLESRRLIGVFPKRADRKSSGRHHHA